MIANEALAAARVAALASLPGCGPARLRGLLALALDDDLTDVWDAVVAGGAAASARFASSIGKDAARLVPAWKAAAGAIDLERLQARLHADGIAVTWLGQSDYPARLAEDPDPPAVLFIRSASGAAPLVELSSTPTVAIVGTRRCTHYGSEVAAELGRELTAAGVAVISGLALGIDGAAHEGALAAVGDDVGAGVGARPIAIVGSGVDVVYPRRHRRLWSRMATAGAVVAESPLGAAADPWRFPLRNRIIAGLADVVVVVESHAAGGSMHTVQSAIDRSVPVMAVPGSVRSPASAGTNALLADGVAPVLGPEDVLVALSLESKPAAGGGDGRGAEAHPRPELDPDEQAVLDAVDYSPTPTEQVLRRTGLDLGRAAALLTRLEMAGAVRSEGGWWERR